MLQSLIEATLITGMSTTAQRRLIKDLQRIQNEAGDQIIAGPRGKNLLKWSATIEGIDQTPWEGGLFTLKLDFTESYPNKPPAIKFTSEMFHPNIYNDGRVCLDLLHNQWSPIYDVWSILTAIRLLLGDPNTLSPANSIASKMFKQNKMLYEKKVREMVEKSLNENEDDELKEEEEEKAAVASQEDDEEEEEDLIPQVVIQPNLATSYNPQNNRPNITGNINYIRRSSSFPVRFTRLPVPMINQSAINGSESDSGAILRPQDDDNQMPVDDSEGEVEEEQADEQPEDVLAESQEQAQEGEYEVNINQDEQENSS